MTPSMPTRVIFLTLHKDPVYLNAALDAGVHGYVLKDSASSEIGAAIKASTLASGISARSCPAC
jgi:DNA-binding NarL/FixJ family response regulator